MKIKTIAAGIAAAVMVGVMGVTAFAAEKKPEPLIQAAAAIDDSLETVWGENRNVSYTLEDNAIFIALWDKGVNEETFGGINNWDAVKEDKMNLYKAYSGVFDQAGIKDGHLTLQYTNDTRTKSLFTIRDGEVVYDYAMENADSSTVTDYLKASESVQKARLAEYTGCQTKNLFFVGTGKLNEEHPVAIYGVTDSSGNEADLRLLLFADGAVVGYNPDGSCIEVANCFAK